MRAITLWQPYASLLAAGIKRHETRSWSTKYRGPLIIHAAARKMDADGRALTWRYFPDGRLAGTDFVTDLPLSTVVAVCQLTDVVRAEDAAPTATDLSCGDYAPGRFAWVLSDVRMRHISGVKGRQGLWVPSEDLIERVRPLCAGGDA